MISVEWEQDKTCENCGKGNGPHCAKITLETSVNDEIEKSITVDTTQFLLCSDCVADLKRRLS